MSPFPPATLKTQPVVFLEGEGLLSRLRLPHVHRVVVAPRDDALAVRGERYALDLAGVPFEGERLLPGLRIPHLYRPVPAPRHDACAVGGKRHAIDPVGVPLEGEVSCPVCASHTFTSPQTLRVF